MQKNAYSVVTWTPATCNLSMCHGNHTQTGMEFFYLYSAILKHEWLFMVKGGLFPTIQLLYNPSKEVSHYLHNCAPKQIMHRKNPCPMVTWTPRIVVII